MADVRRDATSRPLSRKERAGLTRLRMVQAAHRLFLEQGFDATTMQEVADEADVAVQTVYYTFNTKAQLLAEVERFAVLGDRPSTEWRDSKPMMRIAAAQTASELIKAFVAADTDIKSRLAPFVAAVGSALPSDPASVRQRERGREEFFAFFIDRLETLEPLRTGMTGARALDILLAVDSLPAFIELTDRRGWTVRQWQNWLASTIKAQFLAD